jgi:hypothetical protein
MPPGRNEREKTMRSRKSLATALGAFAAGALMTAAAHAADVAADSLKFGPDVVKAMEGYETPATDYIVANPTSVFSNHFYYGGKVTGSLKRGEPVTALAKVKGYEWLLVGQNGTGIGYVPISMLSPKDQYHP